MAGYNPVSGGLLNMLTGGNTVNQLIWFRQIFEERQYNRDTFKINMVYQSQIECTLKWTNIQVLLKTINTID
jgi:hypothetical protein